jgi:hypothetical protein
MQFGTLRKNLARCSLVDASPGWSVKSLSFEHKIPQLLSHLVLRKKPGASHTCAKEDNIYNNIVYRDKCHNNQNIYYIAEDLQK